MQERVKKFLCRLLTLDDTPERIALAFALGVFLAFSPLIGLHSFLGLAFAFLFGLNRFALFLGVFVNNPWTLVPIYTASSYLGRLFVDFPSDLSLPSFEWQALWSSGFWIRLADQWQRLKPMVLGSVILSISASIFSYITVLHMIRRQKARRKTC